MLVPSFESENPTSDGYHGNIAART